MKYFEKTAVSPPVMYVNLPKDTYGIYKSPGKYRRRFAKKLHKKVKKEGIIFIDKDPLKGNLPEIKKEFQDYSKDEFKKMYKQQTKLVQKSLKKHELVHYLRGKKGKWSSKYYNKIPGARLIEETAAYGKEYGNKLEGFAAAIKVYKPGPILRKIFI